MNIQLNGNFFIKPMYQFNVARGTAQPAQTSSANKGGVGYEIIVNTQSTAGDKLNAGIDDVAKSLRSYFNHMDEMRERMKTPGIMAGPGILYDRITDLSVFNAPMNKYYGPSFYDGSAYDDMFTGPDDELLRNAANQLARDYARANSDTMPFPAPESLADGSAAPLQRLEFTYDMPDDVMAAASGLAESLKTNFSIKEITAAIIRTTDPFAREIGTSSLSFAKVTSPLHFDQKIENASALYAFYQDKAARNLTGDELSAALKTIDGAFDTMLDGIADSIIGSGGFTGADAEGIRESVNTLFHEQAAAYSEVLNSDAFDLGVADTEHAWAAESADFVTAKLIQHARGVEGGIAGAQTEAKYSKFDLKTMIVANEYAPKSSDMVVIMSDSEEKLGLDWGLKALYMESLLHDERISDAARETMRASFQANMQNALDSTDKMILRKSELSVNSEYLFDPLDREAVWNTFNRILDTLQADDFQSALTTAIRDVEKEYQYKLLDQYESANVQERNKVTLLNTMLLNSFELYGFADKLNSAMKYLQGADETINTLDFVNTNNDLWDMAEAFQGSNGT